MSEPDKNRNDPPGMAPWNLLLRFALEVAALVAFGLFGWELADNALRYVLAAGLPLVAVVAWGVFNVPGDPSRSGKAPVPVTGWLRLSIELLVLGGGAAALGFAWVVWAGVMLAALIAIHYIAGWKRLLWLLR